MTHATNHNKHPLTSCYALCLAVLLFSIIAPHTAHAVLMTETQIIINSQDRTAELTIKNTSKQTSIYRFVWDHIGFNADGEFKRIEDGNFPDGLTPVDDYIRFAPRRVIAEPGHIQNIRFLARRTKDMPAGEYRSYFSLLPEELPKEYDPQNDGETIGISVRAMVGWKIPVILRHGETTLTAGYKDVRFDPDGGAKSLGRINYTITREGTRSFIGHSELDCNGTKNWLDFKIPFKVYTESAERSTYIDLGKSVASCQSLVLRLVAGESDPEYAGQTLATYKIR